MRKIVDGLIREHDGRRVPVILFTKGGGLWLESMADAGAEALGLDWTCDIGEARRRVGDKVALQGNMDPSVLYAKPDAIRAEVARILASFGHGNGHVFNLGHGITPEVDPAHAGASSSRCTNCPRNTTPDFSTARNETPRISGAFCIAGSVCRLRLRQRTQARQVQRHGEGDQQQRGDEQADAIPAGGVPEDPTQRAGDARAQVVTEQIERGGLAARLPGAAANPAAGDRVGRRNRR